ncbi:MAG: hypothetical protein ACREIB_14575, partial [Pseudomonadota bacterium]
SQFTTTARRSFGLIGRSYEFERRCRAELPAGEDGEPTPFIWDEGAQVCRSNAHAAQRFKSLTQRLGALKLNCSR